jgi:hypothetical protein
MSFEMKRFFVLILALMCADAVMAQPRFGDYSIGQRLTRDEDFILSRYGNDRDAAQSDSNVRSTPLATATLLLLGLSGATVGATIVRNTKKGGE